MKPDQALLGTLLNEWLRMIEEQNALISKKLADGSLTPDDVRACIYGRPQAVLKVGDLEMNRVEHRVKRNGDILPLTPREFALLELLMRNAERPVSPVEILKAWDWRGDDPKTNAPVVYINYLRKKGITICTVRRAGYQIGVGD